MAYLVVFFTAECLVALYGSESKIRQLETLEEITPTYCICVQNASLCLIQWSSYSDSGAHMLTEGKP
jgi:hypothetical protein